MKKTFYIVIAILIVTLIAVYYLTTENTSISTYNFTDSNVIVKLFVVVLIALYFLPSILCYNKKHGNQVAVLNLFLGWTFIGWVVALIWALKKD